MGRLNDPKSAAVLWAEHRAGPTIETRAALIEQYIPLVWKVVTGMSAPRGMDRDDRFQDGVFGLAAAIDRFDPDNPEHATFITYAKHRITGEIKDAARRFDQTSRTDRWQVGQVDQAIEHLCEDLGRWPTVSEVAALLGWRVRKVLYIMGRSERGGMACLDQVYGSSGAPLAEILADPAPEPGAALEMADIYRYLEDARSRLLNVRQRQVLDLYYRDGIIMREIGDRLGITETRVCQIVTAGAARLRVLVGEHL